MRVYTDDEVYRVDRTYLGPKGKRVPWRATYRAYGVWAALTLLYGGIGLSLFPITVLTVGLVLFASLYTTIKVMERLDADRPLSTIPVVGWHELTAPRPDNHASQDMGVEVRAPRWRVGAEPVHRWWHRNRRRPTGEPTPVDEQWVHPFARIGRRDDRGAGSAALVAGATVGLLVGLVFQLVSSTEPVRDFLSSDDDSATATSETTTSDSQPDQVARQRLLNIVADVRVIDARSGRPGYDRETSFGPAWTDDHAGLFGHNDCDTRNDLLARDLTDLTYTPGTGRCDVASGTLDDPYTGATVTFDDANPNTVQGDHVIPLAVAWDLGAWQWPHQDRVDFANDAANLLAVDGSANASKSDQTLADWMTPDNPAAACGYAHRYLAVAKKWDLPVLAADAAAVRTQAKRCPAKTRGAQ